MELLSYSVFKDSAVAVSQFPYLDILKKTKPKTPVHALTHEPPSYQWFFLASSREFTTETIIPSLHFVSAAPAASMHHGVPGTHHHISLILQASRSVPILPQASLYLSKYRSLLCSGLWWKQNIFLKPTPFIHLFLGVSLRTSFLLLFDDHKDNNKLSIK